MPKREKVTSLPIQIGVRLNSKDLRKLEALCALEQCGLSEMMRTLLRDTPAPPARPLEDPQRPGARHA